MKLKKHYGFAESVCLLAFIFHASHCRGADNAARPNVRQEGSLVTLAGQTTDEDLAVLPTLRGVKTVSFGSTTGQYRPLITDAGIASLKGLTELEILRLIDTRMTDAGLAHLSGLTNLGSYGSIFIRTFRTTAWRILRRSRSSRCCVFTALRSPMRGWSICAVCETNQR